MIVLLPASIRIILSSAVVGGIAVCIALVTLLVAQILSWRRDHVARKVVIAAECFAVLMCDIVMILIAARFVIIH